MGSAVKILKHFEMPKERGVYYRLVCLTGPSKGLAYIFIAKRVVLGRSENADVKVADIKSSREHAEIVKVGTDYILTDLGSQNGVVVNDLKVKQHQLSSGDKVIIGKTVYKFNRFEVRPSKEEKSKVAKSHEDESEENGDEGENAKKGKRSTVILLIVALAGVFILFSESEEQPKVALKKKSNLKINEINDPFLRALRKKKTSEDKEIKRKLKIYFQKGLREYREGNYFRALEEFKQTENWKSNDPLAQFYIRKTKEALDRSVEESFLKARRDEESLKFRSAVVSYCSVVRLLYRNKDDERYLRAKQGVSDMEAKIGIEEGSIECLQKEGK